MIEKDFVSEVVGFQSLKNYQELRAERENVDLWCSYFLLLVAIGFIISAIFGFTSWLVSVSGALLSVLIIEGLVVLLWRNKNVILKNAKKNFSDEAYEFLLKKNKVHPDLTPSSPSALCEILEVFHPFVNKIDSNRFDTFMFAIDNAARSKQDKIAYEFITSKFFKNEFAFFFPTVIALKGK